MDEMDEHEQPHAPEPQEPPQTVKQELALEDLTLQERLQVAAALMLC